MRPFAKRIIAVCIIALLALSLAACTRGGVTEQTPVPVGNSDTPVDPTPTLRPFDDNTVVRIYLTVDARSAYNHPGLPSEVRAQLTGSGMLMSAAQLTMPIESKLDATFRVLEISGIPVVSEETDGGTFITSIKGVANGSCGESSRWAVKINGEEVDLSVDQIELKSGDEVVLIYVCDENEAAPTSRANAGRNSDPTVSPDPDSAGRN